MTVETRSSSEYLYITLASKEVRLTIEKLGNNTKEIWLLLPALSTVSSRSEWYPLAESIGQKAQLISFDWPGFGDSDRPKIKYDASTLSAVLRAVLDNLESRGIDQIRLIAAGHSASIALSIAKEHSHQWKQLVLARIL